ncbi:hypothetical protein [Nocardia sputi]|uniref:hypothetical protein n=1 Tax=Nocardia sputi TaxID=2943705 RepID=UPI0020BDCECF|nr:hypothetical protein [Nocardia sputi]
MATLTVTAAPAVAAVTGTVQVDGLRYRRCPQSLCDTMGQYVKGTIIHMVCYTRTNTTVLNGDPSWAKLTNGWWVALAGGAYVYWTDPLPPC